MLRRVDVPLRFPLGALITRSLVPPFWPASSRLPLLQLHGRHDAWVTRLHVHRFVPTTLRGGRHIGHPPCKALFCYMHSLHNRAPRLRHNARSATSVLGVLPV